MFMIFFFCCLDILVVGDLGVQKGFFKWVLVVYGVLEKKFFGINIFKKIKGKVNKGEKKEVKEEVDDKGEGELDMNIKGSILVKYVILSVFFFMLLIFNDIFENFLFKMGVLYMFVVLLGVSVV